jgi:malate permease and related proteins
MILRITAILFPIFAIVALGYWYGRRHDPGMAVANRLNMDIFVPALVFAALAGRTFTPAEYLPLATGALLVLAGCGLLAWPTARALGLPWKTFVPPMMFNNSGNIGIPLAVLAWGDAALPAAVILFMVENLLHFSLGARMLDTNARLLTLWRIPAVAATVAGLAVSLLGLQVWEPLLTALKMLGDIAIPLLLFALGVRMTSIRFNDLGAPLAGAFLRPAAGIAIAWGAAQLLALGERDAAMLMVFGALPPAVLNFLFAERYRQEPERVASIVLFGNLAAVLVLPLVLAGVL